jgi:uncharacterized protein (TIGR03067 family)
MENLMRMSVLLAAVVGTTLLVAAPVPKDLKKKADDGQAILGRWHVESVHDSLRLCEDYPKDVYFEFQASGQFVQTSDSSKTVYPSAYALDPVQSPKRLSLTSVGAADANAYVYDLSGDALVMGFFNGATPPARVTPTKGMTLFTLNRVKDEPKKDK